MADSLMVFVVAAALFASVGTTPGGAATEADVVRTFATTPSVDVAEAEWDPVSGLVLVTVATSDSSYGGDLLAFDPVDGSVAWSVDVGGEPGPLAISDDGSTVYVGLGDAPSLVEVDVATESITGTYPLGASGSCPARFAEDIEVLPGDAAAVIVAMYHTCSSPRFAGVARLDDGVMAVGVIDSFSTLNRIEVIDATTAVGVSIETSDGFPAEIAIAPDGVATVDVYDEPSNAMEEIAAAGGLVFTSDRTVYDASTGEVIGRFQSEMFDGQSAARPRIVDGVVYAGDAIDGTIEAWDVDTLTMLGGPIYTAAERWDLEGLLVTDAGLVVWAAGAFVGEGEPPPIPDAVITGIMSVVIDDPNYSIPGSAGPIDVCIEVWDADTEELILESETTGGGFFELTFPPANVKLLFWDCFGRGLFPEWVEDRILVDWDRARTFEMGPGEFEDIRVNMDVLFVDVPFSAYYFRPTLFLRNAGITQGCGSIFYCPADDVTREQMAAFMARFWRLFNDGCSVASPFGDVAPTSFAYFDVGCIADLGVTTGTSATTDSPGNGVTREQLASVVARVYRACGL
ncbi:MAG: hypothetical protein AAGE98_05085, partial [Actinomycetota bacterium]